MSLVNEVGRLLTCSNMLLERVEPDWDDALFTLSVCNSVNSEFSQFVSAVSTHILEQVSSSVSQWPASFRQAKVFRQRV